ncbi:cellulose synthase catalytic subunit [Leptolyngbya sp. CCNP1308]|uniref:glycosyltransferase family 2 protein n=1 Tax=Leptolyngbya sp. CCNP1308 TaxID=3110255 RepID=UPI002B20BB85|nr:cellulose synthase catalytic subunit [Leptolyngbya sp. CCNP1308]MEA5452863.1 cellulose synthase catalytic subunit [Leptolyngbya sp. CCNP1308]
MPSISRSISRPPDKAKPRPLVRWATLVMAAAVGLAAIIVLAWFAGEARTTQLFAQLQVWQSQPPTWLEVPMVAAEYLVAPTVVLLLLAYAITRLSPRPRPWSRCAVIGILLALVGRYLLWRCLSTLNLASPLEGTLSLGLLGMELFGLITSIIQLLLLLRVRDRRPQADRLEQDVLQGHYRPWVDVFIPTYDEPAFILRRTIIGCQALHYPRKTIYLLDDTRRPEMQAIAAELGCNYISRPDNHHAKAGNLNYAIQHARAAGRPQGELIASFDADFVPTRNFLCRTVGFFQQPTVGLVQTPQSFYNADPIARNLGLEGVLTPEEEVFYRQIQPMRDGVGSVVCSGTSFVVRRSALEATGGFVTESLSEDYFTAVRLAAQGNEVIYLDEKLSAGLAAEDIAAHASQRLRWARGTLQAFFIDSNPLTIPGLSPMQRLGHLEGLLHWFSSIPRIGFLLMPLAYSFLQVIPIQATARELLYYFVPYYLVQLTVFAWLNERSRSALLSDIYSLVLVFPLAATVVQAMVNPFSRGFQVTPKGTSRQGFQFNWRLGWPLVLLFGLTAVSLWRNLGLMLTVDGLQLRGITLGWVWSAYNLAMIAVALLILLDVPRPDPQAWFDLRRVIKLSPQGLGAQGKTWWGITTLMSEVGVEVALTQGATPDYPLSPGMAVDLTIAEDAIALDGMITAVGTEGEYPWVRVQFGPMAPASYRALVTTLFCRPGQWKRWNSPGELQSLGLLLRVLFWPRRVSHRSPRAVPVVKG